MTKKSKTFHSLTIKQADLRELFSGHDVAKVSVGKRLEVALLSHAEYNERAKTLFGHKISWEEGNTITVESKTKVVRASTYNTVNAIPEDYKDFVRASVVASMDAGRNLSLVETFGLAVKALLRELGADGDGSRF